MYIGFVLRSVFLESVGYAHCPMVGTVLAHPFHTQHHFVIVAHAHGFYDEMCIRDSLEGRVDKVELIYHHFKSMGSQVLTRDNYLPIDLDRKSVV